MEKGKFHCISLEQCQSWYLTSKSQKWFEPQRKQLSHLTLPHRSGTLPWMEATSLLMRTLWKKTGQNAWKDGKHKSFVLVSSHISTFPTFVSLWPSPEEGAGISKGRAHPAPSSARAKPYKARQCRDSHSASHREAAYRTRNSQLAAE